MLLHFQLSFAPWLFSLTADTHINTNICLVSTKGKQSQHEKKPQHLCAPSFERICPALLVRVVSLSLAPSSLLTSLRFFFLFSNRGSLPPSFSRFCHSSFSLFFSGTSVSGRYNTTASTCALTRDDSVRKERVRQVYPVAGCWCAVHFTRNRSAHLWPSSQRRVFPH